jgi:multidrug transporter EmrE-like cation transporter
MFSSYVIIVLYVLAIVTLEVCAMSCFKSSLEDWRFYLLGVFFYSMVGLMLIQTFKLTGMAFTNALWSGLSVMATTTVGVLYFKERLHIHDYLAIAMIGGGVLILKSTE